MYSPYEKSISKFEKSFKVWYSYAALGSTLFKKKEANDVTLNKAYVQLVRDLLGEDEWPIQPSIVVGDQEIHLCDLVERRFTQMEVTPGPSGPVPRRKFAVQIEYGFISPDEPGLTPMTDKTLKAQFKEGMGELRGDAPFLRQLKEFFAIRQEDDFDARQLNRDLQAQIEDLTKRTEQQEGEIDNLRDRAAGLRQEFEARKNEAAGYLAKLSGSGIGQETEFLREEVQILRVKVRQAEANRDKYSKAAREISIGTERLEARNSVLTGELQAAHRRSDDLSRSFMEAQQERDQVTRQLEEANEKIVKLEEEADATLEELQEMQGRISQLEHELQQKTLWTELRRLVLRR